MNDIKGAKLMTDLEILINNVKMLQDDFKDNLEFKPSEVSDLYSYNFEDIYYLRYSFNVVETLEKVLKFIETNTNKKDEV